MSSKLYLVVEPTAGGPPVSKEPKSALSIIGDHPAMRRKPPEQSAEDRAEEIAANCVAVGQWKPYEGNETVTQATPPDRLAALEKRLAALEEENAQLRQKPASANRMKQPADNR